MADAPTPADAGRPLRRFLAYTLRYKALLAAAVAAGVAKFALNYTFPWLIGSAVDEVIRDDAGRDAAARLDWLRTLVVVGVACSVAHAAATFGRGYLAQLLGNRIIRDLRQDLFDHLHRLSLHFYSRERTGSIVSRVITDIQQASQIVNGGLIAVVMDLFSMALGLALLLSISWKLTAATLVILPLYALLYGRLNPRVKLASARVQSQISKISGNVQERLAGIALVKTYAAEGRERRRFREDTDEHYDRVMEQSTLAQTVGSCSEGLIHLGQTIVIGYGGSLAVDGDLSAGEVVKFMGWLAVMYLPVRRFAEINVVYQTSLASIERVFEVFDITPKVVERPGAVTARPPVGEVRFEGVRFRYNAGADEQLPEELPSTAGKKWWGDGVMGWWGGSARIPPPVFTPPHHHSATPPPLPRWVLDGLDLVVAPGERVALVGPSGAGKTTLVSLLPRLYDVSEGRIVIDGVDVRDYATRSLRRSIGIVQQDSFLFSGTIRENLAYGRPDATDAEVVAAATAANAHGFVADLPDGYDSAIGERGVTLSGGQRQRLSIARAILKDPRILILDEATSALDSESEHLVQQALERLMAGRTSLIIAHRLGTVRTADRIVVMDRGRAVEQGTHVELVARGGLYARLVRQQFGPAADTPADATPMARAG